MDKQRLARIDGLLNEMVEKRFEGSLPAFIAAFTRHSKLKPEELSQLRQMIDSYEEE